MLIRYTVDILFEYEKNPFEYLSHLQLASANRGSTFFYLRHVTAYYEPIAYPTSKIGKETPLKMLENKGCERGKFIIRSVTDVLWTNSRFLKCVVGSACGLTSNKFDEPTTVNVVIFAGGKFRKYVGKTFHMGVIFTKLLLFLS